MSLYHLSNYRKAEVLRRRKEGKEREEIREGKGKKGGNKRRKRKIMGKGIGRGLKEIEIRGRGRILEGKTERKNIEERKCIVLQLLVCIRRKSKRNVLTIHNNKHFSSLCLF